MAALLQLLGGLGLFLYGMHVLRGRLEQIAGRRLRRILHRLTGRPLAGLATGILVTALLQSSSATTVTVIGLVGAGLLELPQALPVLFGANIGTTVTAQLLAVTPGAFLWPLLFAGALLCLLGRPAAGGALFSFGLLFLGLEVMGDAMSPLAESPLFLDLLGRVAQIPLLGLLLGTCMTLLVQSSSATIAVLQRVAGQAGADGASLLGLMGALPVLVGDNIGTTVTALLASIGQGRTARETAWAHFLFNVTGGALALLLLPAFCGLVRWISPRGPETAVIARQIANAHTLFNVGCTALWLPLLPLLVRIVTWRVPRRSARLANKPPVG